MTPAFLFLLLSVVRGVVLDPTGRPVEGAKIACGSETTTTDSRGHFEFQKPCVANVEKPGFAPKAIALTDAKDAEITLALAPSSDRVLVTAAGAPVAMEEAGVAATVFTAQRFRSPPVPLRRGSAARRARTFDRADRPQRRAHQSCSPAAAIATPRWCCSTAFPSPIPAATIDFSHLTSAGLDRMEVVRGPGERALSARKRPAP